MATDWDSLVAAAVADLQGRGKRITRRAVMEQTGGSPHVIGELIKKHSVTAAEHYSTGEQVQRLENAMEAQVAASYQTRALELLRSVGECGTALDEAGLTLEKFHPDKEPELARWKRRMERLRQAEERARTRRDDANSRQSIAENALRDLRDDASEIERKLHVCEEEIAAKRVQLTACHEEAERATGAHEAQMAALRSRMAQVERELSVAERVVLEIAAGQEGLTAHTERLAVVEAEIRKRK